MSAYNFYPLTQEIAHKYSREILHALDQIPQVEKHTHEQLMADKKEERILYSKWRHSTIALTHDHECAGIAIGYERAKENNEHYPEHCIYLSDFAVAEKYQRQGLGKALLKEWTHYNMKIGFLDLVGPLRFAVQTNAASWNRHVQALYESVGFKKIASNRPYLDPRP